MTAGMNEQVRNAARHALKNQGLTQAEVAEKIGLKQPDIARLLNGKVGQVPENWQKLLDTLGLQIIAVPVDKE